MRLLGDQKKEERRNDDKRVSFMMDERREVRVVPAI